MERFRRVAAAHGPFANEDLEASGSSPVYPCAVASKIAPRRIATGVGGPNGVGRRPVDRWFRYPAGFSAETLDLCFATARLRPRDVLVEPFAGAATAGTEAIRRGLAFRGLEAHPLIAELGQLKFERPGDPDELTEAGKRVASARSAPDIDGELSLIRTSFLPEALRALVGMRSSIIESQTSPWARHLKWALLGTLRDCAAVKVGWPYQRPGRARVPRLVDPRVAFLRRVSWMADDLKAAVDAPDAIVIAGDARESADWSSLLGDRLAAGAITSPPYLNNFDYADATRLELYFWGLARSWLEMTQTVRGGMMVATTQQSRIAYADASSRLLAKEVPLVWPQIRGLAVELKAARAARPRGKEYDLLLVSYFADLLRVVRQIAAHLTPRAPVLLVLGDSAPYGIYVDTPSLIAEMAGELGLDHIQTVTLRRRGLRWHSNGSRHAVDLHERLLVLRSPGGR